MEGTSKWIHFCYDDVERSLRADQTTFQPEVWQEARTRISTDVASLLESDHGQRVVLLDDNMYYRSMSTLTNLCKVLSCTKSKVKPISCCKKNGTVFRQHSYRFAGKEKEVTI